MRCNGPPRYDAPGTGIYAPAMLKQLSEAAGDDLIVTCDVGQHQMWVAQHCRFSRPQAHLTSAGLGTMGYGIPAGIGALLAEPGGDRAHRHRRRLVHDEHPRAGDAPALPAAAEDPAAGQQPARPGPPVAGTISSTRISRRSTSATIRTSPRSRVPSGSKRSPSTIARKCRRAIERLLDTPGPILCHARIDPRTRTSGRWCRRTSRTWR